MKKKAVNTLQRPENHDISHNHNISHNIEENSEEKFQQCLDIVIHYGKIQKKSCFSPSARSLRH